MRKITYSLLFTTPLNTFEHISTRGMTEALLFQEISVPRFSFYVSSLQRNSGSSPPSAPLGTNSDQQCLNTPLRSFGKHLTGVNIKSKSHLGWLSGRKKIKLQS